MARRKTSGAKSENFGKPLPRSFFERDPRIVARELLGKVLVRRLSTGKASGSGKTSRKLLAARIVETEAYLGERDLAAHAASGITPRNAVLFGPAGHAYVYFTYGMYHCMNISCEREGRAGCVLLRALEPLAGLEEMALGRRCTLPDEPSMQYLKSLTSGPGRLCQALHITRADDNGKDVTASASDLQTTDDGFRAGRVVKTERIGISQDTHLQLRYLLAGNAFVSGKALPQKRSAPGAKAHGQGSSAAQLKPRPFNAIDSPIRPSTSEDLANPSRRQSPSHTEPMPARKPPARRGRPARTPRAWDAG